MVTTPEPDPDPEPEPELPTDLEIAQNNAATAAMNAETAATDAKTAAEAAKMAGDMLATKQTGSDMYEMYLEAANEAYKDAMTAYGEAKKQSEAAKAATDVVAAVTAAIKAEIAQGDAETARQAAEEARKKAQMAANDLLMIDDTDKMVGETTIDAMAGSSTVTTGTGETEQTVETGEIKSLAPTTTGTGVTDAVTGVQDNPLTLDVNEAIAHKQQVANRTFPIGKVVDSADDTARLMIITQYAGSKDEYVYNAGTDPETGTKAGYITIEDADTDETDENNVALKSEGLFFAAASAGGGEGSLDHQSEVADDTNAVEVFSYVDVGNNDEKKYVVLTTTATTEGTTTYTYTNVDVEVTVAEAGDPQNGGAEAFDTKGDGCNSHCDGLRAHPLRCMGRARGAHEERCASSLRSWHRFCPELLG